MSHPDCPRSVSFNLAGVPGVQITAVEVAGTIQFTVDVQDSAKSTGDLRALFFHINEAELTGLTVTSSDPLLTESRVGRNNVLDLGDGANLTGAVKKGFDVGTEWGSPGTKPNDINFPVHFTISNTTGDLTLDDIGGQLFGAKIDSVGGRGGPRGSSAKLTGTAPWAPDAVDDSYNIFEDGAANAASPSKTPLAIVFDVLGNDTDHDSLHSDLTIDHLVAGAGPSHGTVTIVNNQISYTPDLDYSGTDSFWYCMSDGHGGQDSAMVTVNIAAVADDPLITFQIDPGATVNETLVTVTATENDADHSETITSLDWAVAGGLPTGVTITPLGPIAGSAGSITQQFVVTTAAETDYNFNIGFTGTATEASNSDTETNSGSQNILIDFTHNLSNLNFAATDQSIWSTGDEFTYDLDKFLGVDKSYSATLGDDDITGTFLKGSAHLKAGFQIDAHFAGGQIDANIPVDVTVDTTYNKTTDTLYFNPSMAIGTGASFTTTGPEGSFSLDFIFDAGASLQASLLWVDLYNDSFSENLSQNIIAFNSTDPPPDPTTFLGGIFDLGVAWPHISVTGDTSGSGTSNDFLYGTLDIDALAAYFLPVLHLLDADPTDPDNFELLDFDLTAGLNVIQEFGLGLGSTGVNLVLEDGTSMAMTFGTPLTVQNASSHDANHDGVVDYSFSLDPNVTLSNETSIGGELSAHLWIPKNFDFSLVDQEFPIVDGPLITVFDDTFALTGVGSQDIHLFA
jgi:hypothetical protein